MRMKTPNKIYERKSKPNGFTPHILYINNVHIFEGTKQQQYTNSQIATATEITSKLYLHCGLQY